MTQHRRRARGAGLALAVVTALPLAAVTPQAAEAAEAAEAASSALTATALTVSGSADTVAAYGAAPVVFTATASAGPLSGPADATYTTTDAAAVVSGSAITFRTPGVQSVTATAGGLTSVTTVTVTALPAAALAVDVGSVSAVHRTGSRVVVGVSGLVGGEPYTVSVGGTLAASGIAASTGVVRENVTLPGTLRDGSRPITVTGSVPARAGTGAISVLQTYKTLRISSSPRSVVLARHAVRITVHGLLKREAVTVRYRGHRISPHGAVADARGVYRLTTKAGASKGLKPVMARGSLAHRRGDAFVFVQHRR